MKTNVKLAAALTLALTVGLTACSPEAAPEAPATTPSQSVSTQSAKPSEPSEKPAPQASSALSLQPTAEPTAEKHEMTEADRDMREGLNTPLSVNLEESFKTYADPMVERVYPDQDYAMEGAKFAMTFLHDLTSTANWYEARDTSKDFELLNTADFTERMDASMVEQVKKYIADEGRFDWIPTAFENGTVGDHQPEAGGERIPLTLNALPTSTYNTPSITIMDAGEAGDALTIHGRREINWTTVEGYTAVQRIVYWVGVVPSGDSWAVTNLGWEQTDSTVTKTGEAK